MLRWATVVGISLLLVLGAGVPALASGPAVGVGSPSPPVVQSSPGVLQQSGDFARTEFQVELFENGSARWTTRYTKPLNETTRQDFEAYAEEFNTTETELYRNFVSIAGQLTRAGENETGRPMNATDFSRRAYVAEGGVTLDTQAVVEMQFTWTNFTRKTGQRIELGDVFEGGLYIGPQQKFIVVPGPGLTFTAVQPTPDTTSDPNSLEGSDSLTWQGEYNFNDERPYVELTPSVLVTTTVPTTSTEPVQTTAAATTTQMITTTTMQTTVQSTPTSGDSSMLVMGVILLLLAAGTVTVWRVTASESDEDGSAPVSTDTGDDGGTGAPPAEPATTASTDSPSALEPTAEPEQPAVSEDELLSDPDRVQQLLDENGGRMRQSAIVKETDWSKSKVSMLLSDMEDQEEITKLRVGRENIISLPGHEPDAAGSPFEDEE